LPEAFGDICPILGVPKAFRKADLVNPALANHLRPEMLQPTTQPNNVSFAGIDISPGSTQFVEQPGDFSPHRVAILDVCQCPAFQHGNELERLCSRCQGKNFVSRDLFPSSKTLPQKAAVRAR
jgi:hypothetical protein